jgi:3-oxoacyl-[acyl-carrier protein] reductase
MMQGQVVLITGSGRGIGRFVTKTFGQAGAKVAIADVVPLDNVTRELKEIGAEVLPVPTDVQDEGAVRSLVEQTVAHFGRIDVLVNNAAVVTHFLWGIPTWPRIRDMEKSFWDKVMNTNLGGVFLCSKYVLPQMEAQRSGHIVNTTGGGNPETFGSLAYAVSKDAIRTFTRFIAEEERAFNVCVVAIAPGTQIATEEAPEEARRRMAGPEFVGNRFVLAAQAGMELSGHELQLKDGRLVVRSQAGG